GHLGVGRTIFLIEQLSSALDAAHAHALVHRDVKPGNILLEESTDHVYLTDFGVAKQTTARGLTSTGHFLGTVEYAAPEQIEGGPRRAATTASTPAPAPPPPRAVDPDVARPTPVPAPDPAPASREESVGDTAAPHAPWLTPMKQLLLTLLAVVLAAAASGVIV